MTTIVSRFANGRRNQIQMKLAQVLVLSLSRSARPSAPILSRARDTHERTMASTADAWCFAVDARFERNGVMSSTTLKCVRLRCVANPRPARRHPHLRPRVFESPRGPGGREEEGAPRLYRFRIPPNRAATRSRSKCPRPASTRDTHASPITFNPPASSAIGLC